MSDRLDVQPVDDQVLLRQRRSQLLVPAILATCLGGGLFALSFVFQVWFAMVARNHPGLFHQPGVTYLPPSSTERTNAIVRYAAPILAGLGLLAFTWRFRKQGRVVATVVCAVGVVLLGIVSVW